MNEPPLEPALNPNIDHAPPYQSMLKESIDHFLAEYRNGVTDFSDFRSIFYQLLQNVPDQSLQFVWFYAALAFHTNKFAVQREPSRRATTAKGLFQLLVSCSDYCGSLKRIGILGPVIYEFYRLALQEKQLKSEVESLLEGLIGYCSIFCGKELRGENSGLTSWDPSLLDVIRVWMVDQSGAGDYFNVFFPIVSDQFRKEIEMGREIDFLAGIVMCEFLLLKMCLEFEPGIRKAEQETKLCNSAIQIIIGLRNYYFLVKGSSDASANYFHVLVRHREQGDYEKAMSYVNAFSRSCIPLQLINWVTSQSEMGTNISKPNVSTPIALLKWLLLVEDQGLVVFDGDTAKLCAKAKVCTSRTEYVFPVVRHFHNDLESNLLGNSIYGATEEDKFGGDIEMVDSMDTMILAADNRMSSNTADGTRKRREMLEDETKSQVKFMRCQFHGNSMRENSLVFGQE